MQSCRTDGALGHFLTAISDQAGRGTSDYLKAQGETYDQVMREFFDLDCDCKYTH